MHGIQLLLQWWTPIHDIVIWTQICWYNTFIVYMILSSVSYTQICVYMFIELQELDSNVKAFDVDFTFYFVLACRWLFGNSKDDNRGLHIKVLQKDTNFPQETPKKMFLCHTFIFWHYLLIFTIFSCRHEVRGLIW